MTITKFLLKNLKKCYTLFFLFTISFIIASFIIPLGNYIISRFIGAIQITDKTAALNQCLFILGTLIIYYIIRSLINGFYLSYIKGIFEATFHTHLINELFTYTHKHSVAYFDDEMSGRITAAISGFTSKLTTLTDDILFRLTRPLISLLFSLGIIATFSPILSLCLLGIGVLYIFSIDKLHATSFNIVKDYSEAQNKLSGIIVDSFANANLVKYSGNFFSEQKYFYNQLKITLRLAIKNGFRRARIRICLQVSNTTFLTLGLILTLYQTKAQNIALEDLFFVYTSLFSILMAMSTLNSFMLNITDTLGTLKAHYDVLSKPITITDAPNAYPLILRTPPTIKLQNINFAYIKEKPVFTNLNLTINAGEKVGLVGYSGSGKSTLMNLILRNYDINSGNIIIEKHKLTDITQESLHKNIAVVSQDTSLFNRSILENIRIANPHATKKEIEEAAKLANIHDTILNLPNGYDSIVGERGTLLSGGERQRIGIARAILQNAPVLILDEATSALDSESEIAIQKALAHIMKNKTVIAIAHRLSTLNNMERIIVLNNGEIIEDSTPKELLKNKNGIFSTLYRKQANGYLVYGDEQ